MIDSNYFSLSEKEEIILHIMIASLCYHKRFLSYSS